MNRAERRRQEKVARVQGRDPAEQAQLQKAIAYHRAGQLRDAETLYRAVLAKNPNVADALHGLGLIAYRTGQLDPAITLLSGAAAKDPDNSIYAFNLGVVLQKKGKLDDAVQAYERALALDGRHVDARCNLGNVFREQGRLRDAAAAYEQAIAIRPDHAEAHNNLGVVLKDLDEVDRAIASYRRALAAKPDHLDALCNLGIALMETGRLEEAVRAYERALAMKPDFVRAHYNLAFALLWQQRYGKALAELRTSADLKQNHGQPVAEPPLYRSRLKHDVEQIEYLMSRGVLGAEQEPYLAALKRLREASGSATDQRNRIALGEDLTGIMPSFNRILRYADSPALEAGAVNPALDVAEIEGRYNESRPEIIFVDELLTPEALTSLRTFCLESTIWKRDYENGYLGAFLGDGFSSPLLLQVAEELRLKFPGIFRDHLLTQAWAFKYDSALTGLNLHADAAAVNVNFWITPSEASLDPQHGGLVVWNKEAPKDWNFKDYNSSRNEPRVRAFLAASGATAVRIPYRANRAVVFNSDLFHQTDRLTFKEGYENRRVNITLLYGRRSAA